MHKIAIFRALYLGDFLCSVPALRAIRKHYPHSTITWIGLTGTCELASRYSDYINNHVIFPGFPLLTDNFDPESFAEFLKSIRDENFDLIIQMQGNGSIINNLLRTFNAKRLVGFCSDKTAEDENFLYYPSHLHEIQRHLALLQHINIPPDGEQIDFPIQNIDQQSFESAKLNIKDKYVCLHPGSKAEWRRWPIAHFAEVGDYLMRRGYQVVITGTKSELDLATKLSESMKFEPVITSGRLSLGGTAVLLSSANFLVTNCTGVSHLAAALKTPSLVISMDGEPDRWGPINKELHKTIDWSKNQDFQAVFNEIESSPFIEPSTFSGEG